MPFTGNGTGIRNADDVFFSGVSQNNTIKYNSTTAKWTNAALVKSDIGLANVDNTSDGNKPISSATQAALNTKTSTTDFANLQGSVAVREDLYSSFPMPDIINATKQVFVHACLADTQHLHQVAFVFDSAVAADDVNYWQFSLVRVNGGGATNIAFKSTKATGGEPIVRYVAWDFDAVNTGAATFSKGDLLIVRMTKYGTAGDLLNGVMTYRMGV
ncbi:hypothetical protein IPL68_02955 [Candidatus Saccharibacteria bacterium]|nr:MAG: hypothetical protein IPL68_02955 [Candidatus Saccharibacteria bacterium]